MVVLAKYPQSIKKSRPTKAPQQAALLQHNRHGVALNKFPNYNKCAAGLSAARAAINQEITPSKSAATSGVIATQSVRRGAQKNPQLQQTRDRFSGSSAPQSINQSINQSMITR